MKNARNLTVKEMIKSELKLSGLEYKKMYSNILKTGKLRVKLFGIYNADRKSVKSDQLEKLVSNMSNLGLGKVEIIKTFGFNSVTVYVDSENIV